jgi:D-glycero-alpha-D-manno-heptose 1-phosphate guanylyltransferase
MENKRDMEAVILAGGMGTRLRSVIKDIPKPMAPVNGKPFLFFVLQWVHRYPVEKIILSLGFRAGTVRDYFGDSFSGIPVEYVIEDQPLGTGGAVKYATRFTEGDHFLVINGDTFFPIDLKKFYDFHIENSNLVSIALKRMKDFDRYGTVECHEDTIVRFREKGFCSEGLINGGIYLINKNYFESKELPEVFSIEKDLMEKEAGSGILKAQIFDDIFIDIGIPEDYQRASELLSHYL